MFTSIHSNVFYVSMAVQQQKYHYFNKETAGCIRAAIVLCLTINAMVIKFFKSYVNENKDKFYEMP